MKSVYILAIDQGTTGSRAYIIDHDGRVVSTAYSEFAQFYPQPGWVEHDAEEIWRVTKQVIDEALVKANLPWKKITGIGITNQRETTVVWNRHTGKPIHKAIVWQCRRTASLCANLKARDHEKLFQERTGLLVDAYFSATKIRWLLDNCPDAQRQAEQGELCFGTIDSWLVWKLSAGYLHVTDMSNASRTMVFNIHTKQWDPELLSILQIPEALLPEVLPSSGLFGFTDAKLTGVPIPISGIAGDQQAALYGQLCHSPGTVKNTYGTGCFMVMNTGDVPVVSRNGLLTTLACAPDGSPCFALEGSVFIAGAAIQWLRDGLGLIQESGESEGLAKSVADTGGVYFVPALVGLGAPYWDMYAKGLITGLTRGTTKAHLVRAALESIAYQSKDLLDAMAKDLNVPIATMMVDGGACRNDFLMQFQADIMNLTIDRPKNIDTTALGAAFLAGLGIGFWQHPSELSNCRVRERLFEPTMEQETRSAILTGWNAAIGKVIDKGSTPPA